MGAAAALVEPALDEEGADAGEEDRPEVERELGHRTDPLLAVAERGISSIPSRPRVSRKASVIPSGNPTSSAVSERFARSARFWTAATLRPAIGPNSGPTTIAPMIRISWSVSMPTAAIIIASTMKARKLADISMFCEVRASTSSQTTASDGRPLAAFSARHRGGGDLRVDVLHRDRPFAVDLELAQVGDDHARVLSGDVAEDHVALGLAGSPLEEDHVDRRGALLEQVEDVP